jgi:hypothetical protein
LIIVKRDVDGEKWFCTKGTPRQSRDYIRKVQHYSKYPGAS